MTPEEYIEAKEYSQKIVKALDQRRALLGMSIRQLSEESGISASQLQRFFVGRCSVGYENFIKIVRCLKLDVQLIPQDGTDDNPAMRKAIDIPRTDEKVSESKEKKYKSLNGSEIKEYDSHLKYAYESLGNAVVEVACNDYRELKKSNKTSDKYNHITVSIAEIEKFFMSQWFGKFTNIDGSYILNKLRKE